MDMDDLMIMRVKNYQIILLQRLHYTHVGLTSTPFLLLKKEVVVAVV